MTRRRFDKVFEPAGAILSSPATLPVTPYPPEIREWIAQVARDIWERRSRYPGDDLWNWLSAEKYVLAMLEVPCAAIAALSGGRARLSDRF